MRMTAGLLDRRHSQSRCGAARAVTTGAFDAAITDMPHAMKRPKRSGASPAGSRSVSEADPIGPASGLVQREEPAVRHADEMRAVDGRARASVFVEPPARGRPRPRRRHAARCARRRRSCRSRSATRPPTTLDVCDHMRAVPPLPWRKTTGSRRSRASGTRGSGRGAFRRRVTPAVRGHSSCQSSSSTARKRLLRIRVLPPSEVHACLHGTCVP